MDLNGPEMQSFQKMDDRMKRKLIMKKLFDDLENNKMERSENSQFENLPKLVLSNILSQLNLKDISTLFRLNKYFFKMLWTSPNMGKYLFLSI